MSFKYHKGSYYLFLPLLWLTSTAVSAEAQPKVQATALYHDECASCHMAYPAELLPARSWRKILNNLDRHFGDNASLDSATLKTIDQSLQAHSADKSGTRRARRILRSVPADQTPLRISELPYIRRQHHEIPTRFIKGNSQVRSLSNCVACHQGAEHGVFNEDTVSIPGYGRWED